MEVKRKPDWLKIKIPKGTNYSKLKGIVAGHGLHTICSSGQCPNMGECWGAGTATFMIAGEICTRSCKFCATQPCSLVYILKDGDTDVYLATLICDSSLVEGAKSRISYLKEYRLRLLDA